MELREKLRAATWSGSKMAKAKAKKIINKIKKEDKIVTTQEEIKEVFVTYSTKLLKSKDINKSMIEEYF